MCTIKCISLIYEVFKHLSLSLLWIILISNHIKQWKSPEIKSWNLLWVLPASFFFASEILHIKLTQKSWTLVSLSKFFKTKDLSIYCFQQFQAKNPVRFPTSYSLRFVKVSASMAWERFYFFTCTRKWTTAETMRQFFTTFSLSWSSLVLSLDRFCLRASSENSEQSLCFHSSTQLADHSSKAGKKFRQRHSPL